MISHTNTLGRLLALDSYHGALGFEIDNATLYQNTVAMRVSMTKGMGFRGILDKSANYVEQLGVPEDQDDSRMSINGLSPGEFAKLHLKLATEIQNTKIFNKTSEFLVNGFDGFLRPVNFLLKLGSSLG